MRAKTINTFIDCDPYLGTFWNHAVGAYIKRGDADGALAVVDTMPDTEGRFFLFDRQVVALLMQGKPDEARSVVDIFVESPISKGMNRALIASAAGDIETARKEAAALEARDDLNDMNRIVLYARMGDREQANAAASRIDAMPLGHGVLNMATYWCDCGAPFDADAAPDYLARWTEAELPWPPPSPLPLPLKDW